MKTFIMLFAVIIAAGCVNSGGAKASASAQAKAAEDERALSEALAGRIAGPPQDCVDQADLGGNKSYGRGVILFGDRANEVIYVNRPTAGCSDLNAGRALQTRTTTTRLCRGDIVTVFDPVSGMQFGGCTLGEFTPYRRAR